MNGMVPRKCSSPHPQGLQRNFGFRRACLSVIEVWLTSAGLVQSVFQQEEWHGDIDLTNEQ
jgi:hypothetical protein